MNSGRRIVEALVVGGGPAGSATALTLARAGIQVELLERQTGPHDVVCGGFLGWDALAALRRLGADPRALGARPIERLRLASGRRVVESRLPKAAAGLSRRCLDEALLGEAERGGAVVSRGLAVRGGDAASLTVRLEDGGEVVGGAALFLATGKHELRGLARPLAKRSAGAVGLRTSFHPDAGTEAALAGVIELHPFDGGYAGLLLQEDGQANLCMSVAAERLKGGGIEGLLPELAGEAPLLGERIAAAAGAEWISVSNVPYGWRARGSADGVYRVGDQGAVIASLAGDGIAMALTSGVAAAEAFLRGKSGDLFQRGWAARSARPLRVAEGLRWAAERPGPRRAAMGVMGAVPGLAALAARLTRIA